MSGACTHLPGFLMLRKTRFFTGSLALFFLHLHTDGTEEVVDA